MLLSMLDSSMVVSYAMPTIDGELGRRWYRRGAFALIGTLVPPRERGKYQGMTASVPPAGTRSLSPRPAEAIAAAHSNSNSNQNSNGAVPRATNGAPS